MTITPGNKKYLEGLTGQDRKNVEETLEAAQNFNQRLGRKIMELLRKETRRQHRMPEELVEGCAATTTLRIGLMLTATREGFENLRQVLEEEVRYGEESWKQAGQMVRTMAKTTETPQ